MVRKLKHHEERLLRKVDFLKYKQDGNRSQVIRRFMIQKPEDYDKLNKICGSLRQLAHRLSLLPPESPTRMRLEKLLLDKLDDIGIISNKTKLSEVEHNATVSAFARRRLAVVLTRLHMAETVKAATQFIEAGEIRVGVDTITDPAYLVTRNMEDFITWAVGSKIKRNIQKYRQQYDDFELL